MFFPPQTTNHIMTFNALNSQKDFDEAIMNYEDKESVEIFSFFSGSHALTSFALLHELPNLTTLDIPKLYGVTLEAQGSLETVKHLELGMLTQEQLMLIPSLFPNLESFEIENLALIQDVEQLLDLQSLKRINLADFLSDKYCSRLGNARFLSETQDWDKDTIVANALRVLGELEKRGVEITGNENLINLLNSQAQHASIG